MEARDRVACLDCKHCSIWGRSPGYSSLTPSEPAYWDCSKGHFEIDFDNLSRKGIKSVLELGQTCTDYLEDKDA